MNYEICDLLNTFEDIKEGTLNKDELKIIKENIECELEEIKELEREPINYKNLILEMIEEIKKNLLTTR